MSTIGFEGKPTGPIVLIAIASAWFLTGPVFGHMGPPWPCLLAGAALALSSFMLFRNPANRRAWGTLATFISVLTLFLGTGAIIPALLGLSGGVTAAMWNPKPSVG